MISFFHLGDQSASSIAGRTDALFAAMALICGAMALLLFALIVFFSFRYRRGSSADRSRPPSNARGLEVAWTVLPMILFLGIFGWAAYDYVTQRTAPADALPVYVVGKQWMWKLQHLNGRREVNELHVPIGRPVRLVMTSEDVIHDFFVPAFRLKQDVVPGRYSSLWFTATRLGEFRLFCTEYCGTEHSAMIGRVVVMTASDFARWLAAGPNEPGLAQRGFALFRERGCSGCHAGASTVQAPPLEGLIGREVRLQDGRSLIADETYVRDAIVRPQKEVTAGYPPIMPSYAGQLDEAEIEALVAYVASTGRPGAPADRRTQGER